MKIENEKLKADYNTRISRLSGKLESVEFDNANLLEKNAVLCTRIKEMEGKIESVEKMSIDSIRKGNWNEQYSRKKNLKIYNCEERRGERLPATLLKEIHDKVGLNIDATEIVAMHRIPGKQGAPRPILLKFLRMESKIAVMRKRKDINETMQIKIGDDITQLNQGLLNRLHLNEHITSAWYFNGHIYGTDLNGDRQKFDIYDSISQKLGR